MAQSEIILYAVKLVFASAAGFFALLYWSKTKSLAFTTLIAGFLFRYVGLVFELFSELGFFPSDLFCIFGIPLVQLVFVTLPDLLFVIAFILLLNKK